LNPRGLIFCFLWHKDNHRPADFDDPDGGRVWFANQLINDACASQAILNIVLNCPDIEIGEQLRNFKAETSEMSAVVCP
jgi:ubiquitin carboxyl-terminal hydrolase L5